MKSLSTKICPQCKIEFSYESWIKNKTFCSRKCKDLYNRGSRISNEEWIIKATEKHNNVYSYEFTDINNKIDGKIYINCKLHGNFLQDPWQHLHGKGCKKCSQEKQVLTTDEFIQKAIIKHKGKYSYSYTEYKSMKEHVIITCPEHGNFYQSPTQHLHHGTGCHICGQTYSISKGETEWLDSLNIPNDKSHRQVIIEINNKKFNVDGIKDNIVYEYLGDFWHGNPNLYKSDDFNILAKKSYGELYNETLNRFEKIESANYKIIYIWETEWQKRNH